MKTLFFDCPIFYILYRQIYYEMLIEHRVSFAIRIMLYLQCNCFYSVANFMSTEMTLTHKCYV